MEQEIAFGVITWRLAFVAAAILLFAAEALVGGFFLVWFALALMVTGVLAHLVDLSLTQGFLITAVLAVMNIGIWWKFFRRKDSDEPDAFNNIGQQLIGKRGEALEDFVAGAGRVKITDTLYSASGEDVKQGPVRVTAMQDDHPVVENIG